MKILTTHSLKDLHTFHVDVRANRIIVLETVQDLLDYFQNPSSKWLILGGGSNVLFSSDFDGDVLVIQFSGIKVLTESDTEIELRVEAGTNWHSFVSYCVEADYGGIENLALIPGSVGAAPIQNIGAYGTELKDVLTQVQFYDLSSQTFKTLKNNECEFDYRSSIFKTKFKKSVIICSVDFRLTKKNHVLNSSYKPVAEWLTLHQVKTIGVKDIYNAVVEIRSSKLPNPNEIGNAGSFFKNPIIPIELAAKISTVYLDLPIYSVNDQFVKIPAAWLIEKAGWKGFISDDKSYGVYPKQALVIVNYNSAKGLDLIKLSNNIIASVLKKFQIELNPEVNIIE